MVALILASLEKLHEESADCDKGLVVISRQAGALGAIYDSGGKFDNFI